MLVRAAPPSLLERLRAETSDQHRRLETVLALTEPGLTRARYIAVLEGFLGFLATWEPMLGAALAEPAFFEPRRRAGLLVRDLLHLGHDAAAIAALPRCPPALLDRIGLDGVGGALGSLYVIEGSALGGRVIARQLAALGLREGEPGCLYFSGYGSATGAMWAGFRARMQQVAAGQADAAVAAGQADAAVAAAQATFGLLETWLPAAG